MIVYEAPILTRPLDRRTYLAQSRWVLSAGSRRWFSSPVRTAASGCSTVRQNDPFQYALVTGILGQLTRQQSFQFILRLEVCGGRSVL